MCVLMVADGSASTVLVIDDEPLIRDVVADALELDGYVVVRATNGREGLDAAAEHRPAVVLLDMNMPVLDGWGFMREYRFHAGHGAPVVVMTAAASARKRCEEVGGDAYLAKPFEIDALLDVVARLAGDEAGAGGAGESGSASSSSTSAGAGAPAVR